VRGHIPPGPGDAAADRLTEADIGGFLKRKASGGADRAAFRKVCCGDLLHSERGAENGEPGAPGCARDKGGE